MKILYLKYIALPFLLCLSACTTYITQPTLYQRLNALDGVKITDAKSINGYVQGYVLSIRQPLDHNNPEKGYFQQRVYLGHLDEQQPVVIETDGYWLNDFPRLELPGILRANMIAVEYRFYGNSKNSGEIPWAYLTVEQGAADHHRIITLLKSIYKGSWVSSGYSKGGMSALIHRRYYPYDVTATVTYDAPMNLALQDPRTDAFIKRKNKAAGECGKQLIRFQRELLQRRDTLIPALQEYATTKNMKFSIGLDVVLEYVALEYTFSFWQRGQKCEDIPPTGAKPEIVLAHIEAGGGFWVYSDDGIKQLEPSFYQHLTQLGYYGFITDDLKDLLRAVPKPNNRDFAPKDVEMVYDANLIKNIITWLQTNGQNIIYLYGENDTWYACAVEHGNKTNAFTLVQKGGYHGTHVKNLDKDQQEHFYEAISQWINSPVNRFENSF